MSTGTLNNYIQTLERMYRLYEGEELARLLSLRDAHVTNKNLRSSDIASLVEGNCVAPLDELIICHLLCVKVITRSYGIPKSVLNLYLVPVSTPGSCQFSV